MNCIVSFINPFYIGTKAEKLRPHLEECFSRDHLTTIVKLHSLGISRKFKIKGIKIAINYPFSFLLTVSKGEI